MFCWKNNNIRLVIVNLFAVVLISSTLMGCTTGSNVPPTQAEKPVESSPNQSDSQDNSQDKKLPEAVASAVLKDASKRTGKSASELKITTSEARTWNDGCLGLAEPGVLCTQALVPGWQVKVTANSKVLVYHTNKSGSVVRLNTAA
ncbi:hypothetical protein NIES4071_96880 [Calothrix sp. NIES-4071]|nr:hypothetical protein NIES4071_96880 [Calothrix sp. NIES-4071]BAZ63953.1 hypothetical protein NIES4105_96810 [Calothrix sp. NIES-4105]